MNRKITFIIAFSVIIMFSMSLFIYAKDAQIDGTHVNVRSGPGTEYEINTQVDKPEQYPILEQQAEWVKLQLPNQDGWIHRDYINMIESETEVQDNEGKTEDKNQTVQQNTPASYRTEASDLSGKTIVIDPGHGGRDVGAIGASGSFESKYTLKTAQILEKELEKYGANVFLTREDEQYISLTSRSSYSNLKNADVFLSIHYNSIPEYPEVQGIDTYYYSERDKHLADFVHTGILEFSKSPDRGIQQEDLQVLRTNHRPAILLELGFISNVTEEEHIQSKSYLEELSRGISKGLFHYFRSSHLSE